MTGLGLALAGRNPAQAGIGAASLASRIPGLSPGMSTGLRAGAGAAGNVLGIIQGLQAGGVSGYGQAGLSAGALATRGLGATGAIGEGTAAELTSALGYAAIPLSVYNFAKNWQSGSTWQDALGGASTGAAIGSVVPGIGTLIGAGIGALVGGLSSAFGGGKTSQEALRDESIDKMLATATPAQRIQAIGSMSPAQATQYIQGHMNAHNQSIGHAEPIQLVWGKNNAQGFITDMAKHLNSVFQKNPGLEKLSPQQLYAQIVNPWLKSKGAPINPNTYDVRGNKEGQDLIDAVINVIGDWQSGILTNKTRVGVEGQTYPGLPAYGG